jgi:hypothetical protein
LGLWALLLFAGCSSQAAKKTPVPAPVPARPKLELLHQTLDVDLRAPRVLKGSALLRVRNRGDALARELPLYLSRFARVGEVRTGGRILSRRFDPARRRYVVPLEILPAQEIALEVSWTIDITDAALRARLGGALSLEPGARAIELLEWHPRLTATGGVPEKPAFLLRVRTPPDEVVIAPGTPRRTSREGKHQITEFESRIGPAELVLVTGRFVRTSFVSHGFTIEVYEPRKGSAPLARLVAVAELAGEALALFEKLFGAGWDERPTLRVAVPNIRGARAIPYALLLGSEGEYLQRDLQSRTDSGNRRDAVLLHELAHLWWGQLLTASGPEVPLLHEGLAEFSMLLALERLRGPDVAAEVRREIRARALQPGPPVLGLPLAVSGNARYAQDRGAMVFETACARLGTAEIVVALKELVHAHRGGHLNIDGLTHILGNPLLARLAAARDVPRVRLAVSREGEGARIDLENLTEESAYVPLYFLAAGQRRRQVITVLPRERRVLLQPVGPGPARVLVDPDAESLFEVAPRSEYAVDAWSGEP